MWNRPAWIAVAAVLCLLGALSSCDVETPERYVRPPIIKSFLPASRALTSNVGDSLRFSIAAMDPDNHSLDYYYVLGDSITGVGAQWTYVVTDTGEINVDGRVTNGAAESAIRWRIRRVLPVNLPPVIVSVSPTSDELTVIVGATVEFFIGAEDPEGKPLSYAYTIGETIVGVSRRYTYEATAVGVFEIRAVVSDGESFVSHTWKLRVAAEPDYVPPAKVVITSLGPGAESGEVDIEWTAVGDDGMEGLPTEYILRTSPQPIIDETSWVAASERVGEPAPAPAGETMRMTVRELPPAQTVFIAVRAVDDFGNLSPLSDLASAKSRGLQIHGRVRDALTGEPLEGIQVKLLSIADTTDADGSFALLELPAGTAFVRAEDEPFRTVVGDYFDLLVAPYVIVDKDYLDLWLLPNAPLETTLYHDFRDWYVKMTELYGTTVDLLNRWETPLRVYVPPFFQNGIDYTQEMKNAFIDWETAVGMNLVEFVDAVPDTGVYVVFSDTAELDNYSVTVWDSQHLMVQGRITMRSDWTLDTYDTFLKVARHEVGHSLGLGHSDDGNHLMVGGRIPGITQPSNDEVELVRCMYHFPRGLPVAWIQSD
jgi:hypothetical protein